MSEMPYTPLDPTLEMLMKNEELTKENERLKETQLAYLEGFISNAKEIQQKAKAGSETEFEYAITFTVKFAEEFLKMAKAVNNGQPIKAKS